MNPLARQRSRESILSWWSDSNPPEALGFIQKNRGTPLSEHILEVYSSYLLSKYISSATKIAILEELAARLDPGYFPDDPRTTLELPTFYNIRELFASPDIRIRLTMRRCLKSFLRSGPTPLASDISLWLVGLLRDEPSGIVVHVLEALHDCSRDSDGAQTVVDADFLAAASQLLKSAHPRVRGSTCSKIAEIASSGAMVGRVLAATPCTPLVCMLRDDGDNVSATRALTCIAESREGARAVVDAGVFDHLPELLKAEGITVRVHAAELLERLATHDFGLMLVLNSNIVTPLMSWLRNGNEDVVASTMRVLTVIKQTPVGAQAAVDADVFIDVRELLESSNKWDWMTAADILVATFATHDSGLKLILNSNIVTQLVSMLRDNWVPLVECATRALNEIAKYPEGAQALVDANVHDGLSELVNSRDADVRALTVEIFRKLAAHDLAVEQAWGHSL